MSHYLIYPSILESHQAAEIAEDLSLSSEQDAAAEWFKNVVENAIFEVAESLPRYHQFICHIDYIEADLYYDYGADYYFVAR